VGAVGSVPAEAALGNAAATHQIEQTFQLKPYTR
jgi:hypothetical protein